MSALSDWDNFYVIVGSSAAALTGLQFVVVTLVADLRTAGGAREINAFATPTIVHLGGVLLLSAVLAAPWHGLLGPAILLAALGLFGIAYSLVVARRTRQQTSYKLVLEDWLFHVWLPIVGYAALGIAPWGLRGDPEAALFAVGAAALLLLFIGIHNAWDTVTYIIVVRREQKRDTDSSKTRAPDRNEPTEP